MPKAKNLKYCRKKAGMTQQKLADALGVAKITVMSWENKKTAIPSTTTKEIAGFFGYEYDDFCDIDLETMERNLASEKNNITQSEIDRILMFRKLPPHIKQMIRYVIVTEYERISKRIVSSEDW